MEIKTVLSLQEIPQKSWFDLDRSHFPFAEYAFLVALEQSGCVGKGTGWVPLYLTAWEGKTLCGALPLYLKDDSYGEYIFDWGWAKAYAQNRIPYYPKLVAAVPFTPVTGPKILLHPQAERKTTATALITKALSLMEDLNCSSFHVLFHTEEETAWFREAGFLLRDTFQFHWRNDSYVDFDDFLAHLQRKKREHIRRERRQLGQEGMDIRILRGDDLTANHADFLYECYLTTIDKKYSQAYLNREFFRNIFTTMSDQIVLVWAQRGETPIACSLNFHKGDVLFGRYWGAVEMVRNLHFELCYYQTIDYAIRHKIRLFEAGAQGEHKLQRGFLPQLTRSAHFIRHEGFRAAIHEAIVMERAQIKDLFEREAQLSPFKNKT